VKKVVGKVIGNKNLVDKGRVQNARGKSQGALRKDWTNQSRINLQIAVWKEERYDVFRKDARYCP
jgi:hypothetical protein